MNHTFAHCLVAVCAVAAGSALAQSTPSAAADAQQRYDAEMVSCNAGNLPAPVRDGCVRSAGRVLDYTLGGPPAGTPMTSTDGRATVVAPEGSRPPATDSATRTSGDGRATVVLPADRARAP